MRRKPQLLERQRRRHLWLLPWLALAFDCVTCGYSDMPWRGVNLTKLDETSLMVMSLPVLLFVQIYRPSERFPKGGMMSQLLDSLQIGDTIDVKGPIGEIVYKKPGQLMIKDVPRTASHLAMLAGGTGITPMYQLLKAVLSNPDDKTMCSLIYANQKPSEILLRGEVSSLDAGRDRRLNGNGSNSEVEVEEQNCMFYSQEVSIISESVRVKSSLSRFGGQKQQHHLLCRRSPHLAIHPYM